MTKEYYVKTPENPHHFSDACRGLFDEIKQRTEDGRFPITHVRYDGCAGVVSFVINGSVHNRHSFKHKVGNQTNIIGRAGWDSWTYCHERETSDEYKHIARVIDLYRDKHNRCDCSLDEMMAWYATEYREWLTEEIEKTRSRLDKLEKELNQ